MPAAAIILPLAETVFGSAISGAVAGAIGIDAATTIGAIETGAIVGAGEGAINAAISGSDIRKGLISGLVGGGVSGGVSNALTRALGGGPAGGPGESAVAPSIGGSPTAASALVGAGSGLAGTTARSLAGGASLNNALQQGLRSAALGGIGGLSSGLAQYDFGASPSTAADIGKLASTAANYALPSASGGTTPSYTPPVQPGLSGQGSAGLSATGPSATLGQSLSIAPTLGYTPGGTVFGSSEGDQPKQRVWNVASLRNIGEEA